MNRLANLSARSLWIIAVGLAMAPAGSAIGAPPPAARIGTVQETLLVKPDWDKEGKDEMKQFEALQKGERPITSDSDRAILENGAKWYAYRLTQPVYQDGLSSKGMRNLVKEAESKIVSLRDPRKAPNANQLAFKDEFDKRLVARLAEVMRNPKPIARINAAMILRYVAWSGQEEAVDVLVETIQDPQENDGVKLWALRGLKEFYESGQGDSPFSRNRDREAKCIQALLDYVQRKPAANQTLTANQAAALSYVRSEAVAALGLTRFPAFCTTEKKKTTIERTTALALLRIIRKDGIVPEPTVAEQVNAVVALSQLQSKLCDEYQMDYAVYQVGRFIVELIVRHNSGNETAEPWKLHAARLQQALEDLKTQAERNQMAKAYVAKLASQAQTILNELVVNPKNSPDQRRLGAFLETNQPASTTLFKGLADSVIKETEKPAEQ